MIKRIFTVAVFSLLMAFFAIHASYAQNPTPPCPPGCDCETGADGKGVLGAMERHAEAMRVEDKAVTQQVIKQNDNALGMTCFDRSVALTSRLGQIFSDKLPRKDDPNTPEDEGVPPLNTRVFTGDVYDKAFGSQNSLTKELDKVLTTTMDKHIKNFDQPYAKSLSSALGATSLSGVLGLVTNLINSVIGSPSQIDTWLNGPGNPNLNGAAGTINTYMGYYDTLVTVMDALGVGPPGQITAAITAVDSALTLYEDYASNTIASLLTDIIEEAADGLAHAVLDDDNTSMSSTVDNAQAKRDCSRIKRIWSKEDPLDALDPTYKSLTGSGPESRPKVNSSDPNRSIPYLSIKQLLKADPTELDDLESAADFLQGLVNSSGSQDTILGKAFKDIDVGGILKGPSNQPDSAWPTSPTFPIGTSVSDIINQM